MTTARAGAFGYAPKLTIKPANPEKSKYLRLWANPDYRKCSPGELTATDFMAQVRPGPEDTVIDFGCGTGRGALMIAILGKGTKVHMLDFAENCLDTEVQQALETQKHVLSFQVADLEKPILASARYGYCTDVMEHIPTEKVETVIKNILASVKHAFFSIALFDDSFGASIGENLHLTVKPYAWWLEAFRKVGAVIHWSREKRDEDQHVYSYAQIYASSCLDGKELVKHGTVNTANDILIANVRSALERKIAVLQPYDRQDTIVMVLGGGPSLAEYWDEIKEKRLSGQPLVTTNGTYNQCIERGINPSAQVVVDAREFNKRFLTPTLPMCKYMLASQCHPSMFDAVPAEQTLLWHSGVNEAVTSFLSEWYGARGMPWFWVPGGSTVMLRVFSLLTILGFRRYEVYGFDSCLLDGKHHAYEQKENDTDKVIDVPVSPGNKTFQCHPWMLSQAQEFMGLMQLLGDEVEMIVKGDGLIAYLLETGAAL